MIKLDDYTIGVSPFGNVYLGKLNKDKSLWLQKKDVTNEFINCVIEKFGPSGVSDITTDGKHTHNVIVVPADKNVIINGEVVCGPDCKENDAKNEEE